MNTVMRVILTALMATSIYSIAIYMKHIGISTISIIICETIIAIAVFIAIRWLILLKK